MSIVRFYWFGSVLRGVFQFQPKTTKIKLAEKVTQRKQKSRETQCFTAQMLELLGRFELPTSSLPIDPRAFWPVPIHVTKSRQIPCFQWILRDYYNYLYSFVLARFSPFQAICWKKCWKNETAGSVDPLERKWRIIVISRLFDVAFSKIEIEKMQY